MRKIFSITFLFLLMSCETDINYRITVNSIGVSFENGWIVQKIDNEIYYIEKISLLREKITTFSNNDGGDIFDIEIDNEIYGFERNLNGIYYLKNDNSNNQIDYILVKEKKISKNLVLLTDFYYSNYRREYRVYNENTIEYTDEEGHMFYWSFNQGTPPEEAKLRILYYQYPLAFFSGNGLSESIIKVNYSLETIEEIDIGEQFAFQFDRLETAGAVDNKLFLLYTENSGHFTAYSMKNHKGDKLISINLETSETELVYKTQPREKIIGASKEHIYVLEGNEIKVYLYNGNLVGEKEITGGFNNYEEITIYSCGDWIMIFGYKSKDESKILIDKFSLRDSD